MVDGLFSRLTPNENFFFIIQSCCGQVSKKCSDECVPIRKFPSVPGDTIELFLPSVMRICAATVLNLPQCRAMEFL